MTKQEESNYRRVWHPCHTHAALLLADGVGIARMLYPPIDTPTSFFNGF
ncbi:hypothetical protein HMPREF0673_00183 [Leyella stercorea DSM 18206]|uniref:Uncharacterized protein n=1 Tax=Leyella stercorea DSM 18206 TaxID=1002367 RepID=G6AU99_9BACT|nr:hypothetical protein HMPREF0673_00183 [Leyella stercorea DSM 18206]